MALRERRRFDAVVLQTEENEDVGPEKLPNPRGDDDVVRIALGGIVAMRLCLPSWDLPIFLSSHNALGMVAGFIRASDTPAPDELLAWNVEATVRIIRNGWGTLSALARELLAQGRISYDDAVAIAAENPLAD